MGYIGLEMCEALRARSIDVAMVKPGPVFLPWLDRDLAGTVQAEVQENGVDLHAGHAVEKIEMSDGQLKVRCGDLDLDGIVGTAVFKVFDLEVARTGLTLAEAEKGSFRPASVTVKTRSRAHAHPGSTPIRVHMIGDKASGRLLGVQMVGREGAAHRINAAAVALHAKMTVSAFSQTDLAYAPPFGPVWDPLLTAANQLMKKM